MESFSLLELNDYIKRVIALNFPEPIWVQAEISQISSSRGHYYIELIQKDNQSSEILARASATLWYKTVLFLKKKLQELLTSLLQEGIEVRAKVQVEFHERYGLKLNIQDIDPGYTLGQLELTRQEILKQLKEAKLLDKNKALPLNSVIQKIAVISSSGAAGYKDFTAQLNQNPHDYVFYCDLFDVAVQGKNVSPEVTKSLIRIAESGISYDCIIIIRGGGSKIDLSGFDDFEIGKHIALSPVPVITGIGHEIDQTIADLCAKQSLKTPTAVANFILDHNLRFESDLNELVKYFRESVVFRMKTELERLGQLEFLFTSLGLGMIDRERIHLGHLLEYLHQRSAHLVNEQIQALEGIESIVAISTPEFNLKKGYALLKKQGKYITTGSTLKIQDVVEIILKQRELEAIVQKIEKR